MRIHVLGLGPIGCLLAHNLRRALPSQHAITLIHKTASERQELIHKGFINIEHKAQTVKSEGFEHEISVKELQALAGEPSSPILEELATSNNTPIDSLFVALKAQQTLSALKALSPRLSANSTIVLFQNGMGIYEKLISQVFRNPRQRPHFIISSNTHGAFVKHRYHVVHAGIGSIEFGIAPDPLRRDFEASLHDEQLDPADRRLRISDISYPGDEAADRYKSLRDTVASLLLMQDLRVSWKPLEEFQIILQRKLVVNAAINPLGAIFGCRNGELFNVSFSRDILRKICQEASDVFAAKLNHENQTELRRLRQESVDLHSIEFPTLPEELTAQSLEDHVLKVAEMTRGNVCSMLQDVRSGRKTEIEFINGYIEDLGAGYGVPTPVNSTLRDLVRTKYFIPTDQFL